MLRIYKDALMFDLTVAYIREIERLTDWIWTQVNSKAPKEVDRNRVNLEVKTIGNFIIGEVSAAGIGALTTEWGSGSLADESNPMWDEYMHSAYWNNSRFPYGHPISGRPAGEYLNLDNEMVKSSGKMEGLNLEGFLPPTEPQHWMREIVELSRPTILERLFQVVMLFPFQNYIYNDGR